VKELSRLLNAEGRLERWPSKPKEKTLALEYLASKFAAGERLSEPQVNDILKAWHTFADWALLRRELFERGFLERDLDGKNYRRSELPTKLLEGQRLEPRPTKAKPIEHRLSLRNIHEASKRVDPVFLNTPQYLAESLSELLGLELIVKVETLNPIRSFKGRGADYFISKVMRRGDKRQIVCASAGNFGQAMAYACRKHGIPLIVYASVNANPLKLERMRKLGAELRLHGEDFDAAKLEAKRLCAQTRAWMVEDSKEPEISEGAGTLGLELLKYPQPLDAALIALGNGAMIAGMGRWIKAHRPQTQVIGVCAAGAPAMERSWRSGSFVQTDAIHTIADGIGVRVPVLEALEDLKGVVDDVLLVEDEVTLEAMRLAHQHLGTVLEPSGAVGIAAVMKNPQFKGKRVATVLCGGNLTPEQMERWL